MNKKRSEQAEPQRALQSAPVLELAGGDQLDLITRDAAVRTEALTGLLVASDPPLEQLEVLSAYRSAVSEDGRSPTDMLSGFAGRVVESGRTTRKPIAMGRKVAAILGAAVRSGDTVGRYGGDEFIVVLPDTDSGAAQALAERLRSRIRTAKLTGGPETLDASIGVAQWRRGATGAELVSAADDALRAAKLAGGGDVVTAGDVAAGAGRDVAQAAG